MGSRSRFGKRMAKVDAAGSLEELVWTERHRASWGDTPSPELALDGYAAWKRKHLKRLQLPGLAAVTGNHPRPLPLFEENCCK